MDLKDYLYQACVLCLGAILVHADNNIFDFAPLLYQTDGGGGNVGNTPQPTFNMYPQHVTPGPYIPTPSPYQNSNRIAPLILAPGNIPPPSAANGYIKVPQLPIAYRGFPGMATPTPSPLEAIGYFEGGNNNMNTVQDDHLFLPDVNTKGTQSRGGYVKISPNYFNYFRTANNQPISVKQTKTSMKIGQVPHGHASGIVIQGPVIQNPYNKYNKVDQRHHLPLNHLFVPLPVTYGVENVPEPVPTNYADILIVIDASEGMGHIDANGLVRWNSGVVKFLKQFIASTPMGQNSNRIGVVVVSFGIDDMIPLTNEKAFLIKSLANLRPTFRGGCSEKGIGTASNLFYQYGRKNAVKRIVLLTEGSKKCPYRNMAEVRYAQKCGIDIVHVGIGAMLQPKPVPGYQSVWVVKRPELLIDIAKPVAERSYIPPVHGRWSDWSKWNPCSATGSCYIGYQMRFRICDNPKAAYGGRACSGFPAETQMCHMKPCISNTMGHWTRWSEYTVCSSPCGAGIQTRSRKCLTLAGNPSATCKGKYVQTTDCSIKQCPVDGRWSIWSQWGLCTQTCGAGVKMRVRQCDSPSPKHGGKPCIGIAVEEANCDNTKACPIHGGYGPWSEYSKCEGYCGMGVMTRSRRCDSPFPQFGGNPCQGDNIFTEPCDTMTPCPIDGRWTIWSEWTLCEARCGNGIRRRTRACKNPPPQFGGAECKGYSMNEQPCKTGIPCSIDGGWSLWSDYSSCSAECGDGSITRTRICNNPMPQYGGKGCVGPANFEEPCKTGKMCPVNGGWGYWTEYSVCPAKCGQGIVRRTRVCDNPRPEYGGSLCIGIDSEDKMCDSKVPCPVDGYWSSWSYWGDCSAACGKGFRQRHRLCNNPEPKFGGNNCPITDSPIDDQPCDTLIECPIPGGWSDWHHNDKCSAVCGVGTQTLRRNCDNPAPMYGGPGCIGEDFKIIDCATGIDCPIDGDWSRWSAWGACDARCGIGQQIRSRACDNPASMYNGRPCLGEPVETKICDSGIACAIHGGWSVWLEWSACDVACGAGTITRKRVCDSPLPQYGGMVCDGYAEETQTCDTYKACPIHGGWSRWSGLSPCSVTCGAGTMERARVCDSPAPKFGGDLCLGYTLEKTPCNTNIYCPVHGNWGFWSEFSQCDATCGMGSMIRKRFCDSPAPLYDGMNCVGMSVDKQPCDSKTFCSIDGGWTNWSDFTTCNVKCGQDIITRTRECIAPAPAYGGKDCAGSPIHEKICDTKVPCPVDGNWGTWQEYGVCSSSCGSGIRQRRRLCNDPPPSYGGGMCQGSPLEEAPCLYLVECPINGGWTVWGKFQPCSVSCGFGVQQRVRECTNPAPMYNGLLCDGLVIEERKCKAEVACPLDGNWSPWSGWEGCSVDCGVGKTMRKRVCSNPPPTYGGKPCIGEDIERMSCETGLQCAIDGGWSYWGEYSQCSVTCGVGVMQRHRVCDSPLPHYGGMPCVGLATEKKICDTNRQCPVDGVFSQWSKWSVCGAKCGDGEQTRTRLCNNPPPMNGGAVCVGFVREDQICYSGNECPINGQWSVWSEYSFCDAKCGMGLKKMTRECNNPAPMYKGLHCIGKDFDIVPCDSKVNCAIGGGWSDWSYWTDCSASCGVGVQERLRSCTNPLPQYGGPTCIGAERLEQVCNSGIKCPIDGGWGFWSDWKTCSVTCGKGFMTRTKICNNPAPAYNGVPCFGEDIEKTICETGKSCPINGRWSSWTYWSGCSASCGMGSQTRTRGCTNPAPAFGGELCFGDDVQTTDCDSKVLCQVDGQWSNWLGWNGCSVTCGMGTHGRTRNCDNPPASYGGLFCKGLDFETGTCNTNTPCPVDGYWSEWGVYGPCKGECGMGMEARSRKCLDMAYGGLTCVGDNVHEQPCDTGVPCAVDGHWTPWSTFGTCSAACGMGTKTRTRLCVNPAPMYGGLICKGYDTETVDCDSNKMCSIDGAWGKWYEWSMCSVKCGFGKQERRRECNAPKPAYGGLMCEGNNIGVRDCDTGVHCPIHGDWSAWSAFSKCSTSCGKGIQIKARSCTNPVPQYGGLECVGDFEASIPCSDMIKCPLNGNWGSWGDYLPCNAKCGVGMHSRMRLCNNPAPQYDGYECKGPATQDKKCDSRIPCFVHGGWSYWSPWSGCSVSCGMGEQVRVRQCNSPSPLYGGLMCKGLEKDTKTCKSGKYCPVNGGFTLWGKWGKCDATCGMGVTKRFRTCTAPVPEYGGVACQGFTVESMDCNSGKSCPINGGWTLWTLWSGCSTSCGEGVTVRTRVCDDPPPQFGGAPCDGFLEETKPCNLESVCPIHGRWSYWTPWSDCSEPCGPGFQVRLRKCDAPIPAYGGLSCNGFSEETQDCQLKKYCPIHGGFDQWSHWGACMAKCGVGVRERVRGCNSPTPLYGGLPCKGLYKETMDCDSGRACPVNGNWSPWSKYSTCSATCGFGDQTRARICNNPPPQNGGMDCHGDHIQSIGCDSKIFCPVHGNWGKWYGWSKCNVQCGSGEMERRRECDNPTPAYGGLPCEGLPVDVGPCNTNIHCSIDGKWGEWSLWNKCSALCGMGSKTRVRECSNPPPQYGGVDCMGLFEEEAKCDSGISCPIDGNWGAWEGWGKCSVKCGLGMQSRKRYCNNPPPQHNGLDCYGSLLEEQQCDTKKSCSIHGGWSNWSPWGGCSVDCGYGIKKRVRKCSNPIPKYGGLMCTGKDLETMKCDAGKPCPIDGQWGYWYEWSMCSTTCGVGSRERRRECDAPGPKYGGLPCKGVPTEVEKCDSYRPCPINGDWTSWSYYGGCSHSCGIGTKTRSRTCENPPPSYDGLPCKGPAIDEIDCKTGLYCPVDGQWSQWTTFSPCIGKCGMGRTARYRECNSPFPENGGMDCVGDMIEEKNCNTNIECPIDGEWMAWSVWSQCRGKCGMGNQERSRDCANPVPMYGGRDCAGLKNEMRDCFTGFECPIHGDWSAWSKWKGCSVKCGVGKTHRVRTCTNPRPQYGGDSCFGVPEETDNCDTKVHCEIDGQWSTWSVWDTCGAYCGYGDQRRVRTCTDPKPMYGGKLCPGKAKEARKCDSGIPCAIDGHWSDWEMWSKCDAICGSGRQDRIRTCTNPPPQFGGQICNGKDLENRVCESGKPCPTHGQWADWSAWDMCDAKCGMGTQMRIRTCSAPRPMYGGDLCYGTPQQEQPCDSMKPCVIHGQWGQWKHWSDCSVMCGFGVKTRERVCDSPAPQYGGDICLGPNTDTAKCDTGLPCIVQGGWSHWSIWSTCTKPCGGGMQFRSRACDNPLPVGYGADCKGFAENSRLCNTQECPIHGHWSEWSMFTKCAADCSNGASYASGTKIRERVCNSPAPQYGGRPCIGFDIEKVPCYDYPPCIVAEWSVWNKWTKCSESCGPGERHRTRDCIDSATGKPTMKGCNGNSKHVITCQLNYCPLVELNCTAECKWDNGIGYLSYVGDCSMFVQCTALFGTPQIQTCGWGTIWSLDMLQCVYPSQAKCSVCTDVGPSGKKPYFKTCSSYWDCNGLHPVAKCCPKGYRFDSLVLNECVPDKEGLCDHPCPPKENNVTPAPDQKCMFRKSTLGSDWYEQEVNAAWIVRRCSYGTIYDVAQCGCIYYTEALGHKTVCKPELELMFDTEKADKARNVGLQMNNVQYRGDGTAYFDGNAAINSNIFANSEWGTDVYVYIRFKPEGTGQRQGLVHNSGCGKSDIGPSVFIGIDRNQAEIGQNKMKMKFAAVPSVETLHYEFVNITAPDNKLVDAWFKFGKGQFTAEVDGLTAVLDINAREVARRHGALNIGGNLCKIGNESFSGFIGVLDEVRIYKCKPPGRTKK